MKTPDRFRTAARARVRDMLFRGLLAAAVLDTEEQATTDEEARTLADRFTDRAESVARDLVMLAGRLLESPHPIGLCCSRSCRDRLAELAGGRGAA